MKSQDYANLSPETIIDAVESLGYRSDCRVLALNSYENRVYQVGIEEDNPVIVKFYRPHRWTTEQILEEHQFCDALHQLEVPTVPPIQNNHQSLFEYQGYRFALYPRRGGHAPELDDDNCLFSLGQHIGRIHAHGMQNPFRARPQLTVQSYAIESREFILRQNLLPPGLEQAYANISQLIIDKVVYEMGQVAYPEIGIHADCHLGNILVRPNALYIVDFDDARNGPAMQDLWMLISGEYSQKCRQLKKIIEGYTQFCEFDYRQIHLIEPLRALRIIHHSGWIAKRWNDPAFPVAFPWFNTERYWSEHILALKEQYSALDEPDLDLTYS